MVVHKDNVTTLMILFILVIPPVCFCNNIDMKVRRIWILIIYTAGGVFSIYSLSLLCQFYHVIEYFTNEWHVFLCAYCMIFFTLILTLNSSLFGPVVPAVMAFKCSYLVLIIISHGYAWIACNKHSKDLYNLSISKRFDWWHLKFCQLSVTCAVDS